MLSPRVQSLTLYGNGRYTGNIIQGGSALQPDANGVITITGAATIAPDAGTNVAFAMCRTLVLDGASASLTASVPCKGLLVFANRKIELKNGAGITMTKKGVAGQVMTNPTLRDLVPSVYLGRFSRRRLASFALQKDGAAGAAPKVGGSQPGGTGTAGGAWQSGGGGSGAIVNSGPSGAGGMGSCFSSGAGGGAVGNGPDPLPTRPTAGPYGGAGGRAYFEASGQGGGGAGNPGGQGWQAAAYGETGTAGLLILVAPDVLIGSGCVVQSDGAAGGALIAANNSHGGGGGTGGGILGILYRNAYTNNGTARSSGGPGGLSSSGSNYYGGPGGPGSVNIQQAY